MALGLTQPPTEMSTRSIFWGKGSQCVRLTTYHHRVSLSQNLGTLTSWNPLGHCRPVMGLIYLYLRMPILPQQQACVTLNRQENSVPQDQTPAQAYCTPWDMH